MRGIRPVVVAAIAAMWLTAFGIPRDETQLAMKSETSAGHETAATAEFQTMLAKLDEAQQEFHNGRPAALKAFWSHADDVTLAGGSGGAIEKGWEHVRPRLDWASSQYSRGVQTHDRIMVTVSRNFAYVVQLEHIRFHVPGQAQESKRDYRVTMVCRREPQGWRIVHRQADTQAVREAAR